MPKRPRSYRGTFKQVLLGTTKRKTARYMKSEKINSDQGIATDTVFQPATTRILPMLGLFAKAQTCQEPPVQKHSKPLSADEVDNKA